MMRGLHLWMALAMLPVVAWADASMPEAKTSDLPSARRACLAELTRSDQLARAVWNAAPPSEGMVWDGKWNYQRGGAMPVTRFDIETLDYITAETTVTWPGRSETWVTVAFLPDRVPGLSVAVTDWEKLPLSPGYYDHLHRVRVHPSGSGQIWIRSSGQPIVFPPRTLEQLGAIFERAIDGCARRFPDVRDHRRG